LIAKGNFMLVWVIIPAHNEAERIGRVIRGLFEHGWKNVVVVDDGSSDNTAEVARAEGVNLVRHEINRGQGAALQTGNEYAWAQSAEIIVHFDGDDQFDAGDIKGAVELLQNNSLDVVLGSKILDNRSLIPGLKKYFIIPIGRVVNFLMTGVWLTDVHNGFRVLTPLATEKIVITQDGMAHNSDILRQIKKLKLPFAEYPVKVVYHEFGQGTGGGVKIIFDWLISLFVK